MNTRKLKDIKGSLFMKLLAPWLLLVEAILLGKRGETLPTVPHAIQQICMDPFENCWIVIKLSGIKNILTLCKPCVAYSDFSLQKAGVATSFYFKIIKFPVLRNEALRLEIDLHFPAAIIEARRRVQLFP